MTEPFLSILSILLAYLSGSLAFALWITRLAAGVDVRRVGSGHATATNTFRQAGWKAALLVAVLDLLKGLLPVYLAQRAGIPAHILPWVGAAAVAGHCWSVFAGFRGGMGLATTAGALWVVNPMAVVIGLGWLVLLLLVIRHAARAALLAALTGPWVAWVLGLRGPVIVMAVLAGLIVALRYASNWGRKYTELWLDRGKS